MFSRLFLLSGKNWFTSISFEDFGVRTSERPKIPVKISIAEWLVKTQFRDEPISYLELTLIKFELDPYPILKLIFIPTRPNG